MPILHAVFAIAAEPASIFYIITGAAGFVVAGLRKSPGTSKPSSTAMLFCRRSSRTTLKALHLL